MKRLTWNKLSTRAFERKVESEKLLEKAVRMLMREKKFSEEAVNHFGACYAGGNETVVNFCGEGEFADLDLREASVMTKEEIINRISRYLSNSSKKLLN